jgi:DNA-binding beta-propeller fold protein YncE
VTVYGSFHFAESCTFDPERNLILAMNRGNRSTSAPDNDGYASFINPNGSVHTSKWIGATRDGLELHDPIGSVISNGILYTADNGSRDVRSFNLETGEPLRSVSIPGAGFINGIAATAEGMAYLSDSRAGLVYEITADGDVSIFAEGEPLSSPNGVAMDNDGNIVVVNMGNSAVTTFSPSGEIVKQENAVEGGGDGVVVLEDGTKYISSVRYGSVSRIDNDGDAQIIAQGIPNAASMCYDSVQHQLVIPMNPHYALAFIKL